MPLAQSKLAIHESGLEAGYGDLPILSKGENMRLPRLWFEVLALSFGSAGSPLYAQSEAPRRDGERSAFKAATEEEVVGGHV